MSFLLISDQAEYVNNNKLNKISRQRSIYAYFFKLHLEKYNYKVHCIEIKDINDELTNFDHCFVTFNRGCLMIKNQGKYNILRSKIKGKICTICGSSKFVGPEDLLFFILGKRKQKCVRIDWMAEPTLLKPEKDDSKITILVDHKYYGDKKSRIYKTDKTEFIIKSLLDLKKNRELLKDTPFYEKPIEILHISENGVNVIEKEEDIKEYNQYKSVDYNTMIKIYNKADIFVNTHYECMGMTNLECAMSGALILTFDDFIKKEFLNKLHHHKIVDDNVDWLTIFKKIDIIKSRNTVLNFNYKNTIDKLIKHL